MSAGPFFPPVPPPAAANGEIFRLYTAHEPQAVLPEVLRILSSHNNEVTDLAIGTPSLEDVYVHLTGKELR